VNIIAENMYTLWCWRKPVFATRWNHWLKKRQ
jgi:hypothetical protein